MFVEDVRCDQQGEGHLPLQRHQRLLAAVAVQPDPARGHLHHGPPALLLLHHSHHSHQLRSHDHAGHTYRRIQRVSLLSLSPLLSSPQKRKKHKKNPITLT